MEVVDHQTLCKASKVSPQAGEDVINSMPKDVVTNIMNRLPLIEAVGTSTLSRSWRFNWTLLTQLILDLGFFYSLDGCDFDETNISRLLLHLKGPITKFVLHIDDWMEFNVEDMHHWFKFLSGIRGFKELTLLCWHETPVKLPTHLFSCLDLKRLELYNCVLSPPPYFRGFPKLVSLDLCEVSIQDHKYGELIVQCPLLETLFITNSKLRGGVKLIEIAKLKNLKMLKLPLCLLDNISMVRLSTVFQHLSLLPKLQELHLYFENCKTLHITAIYKNDVPLPAIFSPEVDCSTMGQLQLRNVNIASIKGLENEVCFIKCMLACSPMLKRLKICSSLKSNDGNEKYNLASKLLKLQRASPMAEIIF